MWFDFLKGSRNFINRDISSISIIRNKCNSDCLNLNYNKLRIIETGVLPKTLKELFCCSNLIHTIEQGALPDSLLYLNCNYNVISSFDNVLPQFLQSLYCAYNKLTSIDHLPDSIEYLDCTGNHVNTINKLPNSLRVLYCGNNSISDISTIVFPEMVSSLTFLNNCISSIDSCIFPNHINTLILSHNLIESIEVGVLPESLVYFDCSFNRITSFCKGVLPVRLDTLICSFNPIVFDKTYLPVSLTRLLFLSDEVFKISGLYRCVDINSFVVDFGSIQYIDSVRFNDISFTLRGYKSIVRLQKRIKHNFARKTESVKYIQYCMEDWLFKPVCNDNTIGISVMLEYTKMKRKISQLIS